MKRFQWKLYVCICVCFIVSSIVFCIDDASAQRPSMDRLATQNRLIPMNPYPFCEQASYNHSRAHGQYYGNRHCIESDSMSSGTDPYGHYARGILGISAGISMRVRQCKFNAPPQIWSMGALYGLLENYPPLVEMRTPSLNGTGLLDSMLDAAPRRRAMVLASGWGYYGGVY